MDCRKPAGTPVGARLSEAWIIRRVIPGENLVAGYPSAWKVPGAIPRVIESL